MLEQGPHAIQQELGNWTIKKFEGWYIIFFKGKNYILWDDNLRWDITRQFHNHETAGHPGELETYNALRQHYWWTGLRTYIKNYVRGCGTCQQFKIDRSLSRPTYLPTEGAQSTRPFANCSMDFITDLPPVNGFDSILVVVDQGLTKGVILTPCKKQSPPKKQVDYYWKICINNSDYRIKSSQIKDPSLLPNILSNCWNCWELLPHYRRPITLKQMAPPNG